MITHVFSEQKCTRIHTFQGRHPKGYWTKERMGSTMIKYHYYTVCCLPPTEVRYSHCVLLSCGEYPR